MAQFLTTSGVASKIEDIITGARSLVILISPYLQLSDTLFQRLRDAERKKTKVVMVYGKDDLKDDQRILLSQLTNLSIYYLPNLHAKCYFNESLMVITSMNLHQFSEKTNREMGILMSKDEDKEAFSAAVVESRSIVDASTKVELGKQTLHGHTIREAKSQWPFNSQHGFCIRCGGKIKYDTEKPYCKDCYSVWADFENPDYEEQFCHECGSEYGHATMEKPLCRHCYVATQK